MPQNPATSNNVPPELLEEADRQEKEKAATGILSGLVGPEKSTPKPVKRVTDIRSGHGYT